MTIKKGRRENERKVETRTMKMICCEFKINRHLMGRGKKRNIPTSNLNWMSQ